MIIFLDIDGVLNQLQSWHIDDKCVAVLQKLCRHYDAKIVLTSSWKSGFCRNKIYCTPQIIKLIDKFETYGLSIYNRTENLGDRSLEIERFIERYNVTKYIILDDDISLFSNMKNLYIINSKTGLTEKDYKKIIRLFK